jgi:Fur family transcriptional regulator, ferric uptake regulator
VTGRVRFDDEKEGEMAIAPPEHALREAGLRPTRQRLTVLEALRGRDGAVTAQDLHAELRQAGGPVGLTTVYRTLTSLADAGFLDTFNRDGEQAFRLCGDAHHHHLVCETCNRVEEITAEEVERWISQVAEDREFRVTGHRVDVFGICAACEG